MIIRIHIRNFALIDNVDLELAPGFNVLSGETGAGKSIIIDAMGLIIGNAGFQDYIRTGEDKALVEALFDVSGCPSVGEKLGELGVDTDEDSTLLLTREIQRSGKNSCRINGRAVTLTMYREIGELLVDIYGQNHQQSLLRKEKHLFLLDAFGGTVLQKDISTLREVVLDYTKHSKALLDLKQGEAEKARRLDMYNFQLSEIDEADLKHQEEEALTEELTVLENAERLAELAAESYTNLYVGVVPKPAALDLLHKALADLKELAHIDGKIEQLRIQLEEAIYQVEDCAREIRLYQERVNSDPYRLNQVIERLNTIKRLKRKYGDTVEGVLNYRREIAAAVEQIANSDEETERLQGTINNLLKEYNEVADRLSECRQTAALKIEECIRSELSELNMPHVEFKVQFLEQKGISSVGKDDVEFLISPNPGEPLKPLAKIASGGEISRIMLAMKTILAAVDEIPTLIFDEIDTGLGGKAVQAVAQKLALIGKKRQVICVTHSPHVAGFAEKHFSIVKETKENRTVTKVDSLEGDNRVNEIARMLGGNHITQATVQSAVEIIKLGSQFQP